MDIVSHELVDGKYIVSGTVGVISASFFLQLLDNSKIIKKWAKILIGTREKVEKPSASTQGHSTCVSFQDLVLADSMTASQTRCVCNASLKVGAQGLFSPTAFKKSAA